MMPLTLGFMQVGHDIVTSANCKFRLWFGQTNNYQLLYINSSKYFNQQRLWADGILIPNLHKALLVSRDLLKQHLSILLFVTTIGCSSQPNEEILAVKIDTKDTTLNIKEIKPDNHFSRDFLNYLVDKFPTASKAIFYPFDTTRYGIKLSDTAYVFGMISFKNRIFLLNSLPKDLSKEQSDNYFKKPGLFIYNDSDDLARQDSLFAERIKWTKAPSAIEAQFLKFYALLKSDRDYLIIVPTEYIKAAPW